MLPSEMFIHLQWEQTSKDLSYWNWAFVVPRH